MTTSPESSKRQLVVGIDYSELASLALETALLVAARWEAVELHALAVAERDGPALPEELTADVKQAFLEQATGTLEAYVRSVVQTTPSNVTIVPHVAFGNPKERLLELAERLRPELMILGTHARQGIERWVLGSVTETVIREASCPVLAVRQVGVPEGATQLDRKVHGPRRLMVAVDFSAGSRAALREAARWGSHFGAELYVLHVLEPARFVTEMPPVSAGMLALPVEALTREHVRARLQGFLRETFGDIPHGLQMEVHEGSVSDTVPREVIRTGADWLVVGTHGRRGFQRALLGSVAEALLRHCECPVLAVHAAEGAA